MIDLVEMELIDALRKEVDKIEKKIEHESFNGNIGLYTGLSGKALLYTQLFLATGSSRYSDITQEIILQIIEQIEVQPNLSYTFSSGLAGFGWLLNFLVDKNILNFESEELIIELHTAMELRLQTYLSINNFDQINGAISIARYFISAKVESPVKSVIQYLDKNKIESDGEVKWPKNLIKDGDNAFYDFGLAHGVPGIMGFLLECLKSDIETRTCERLIRGSISFLFNNIQDLTSVGSYFPHTISYPEYNKGNNKPEFGRLSWCYGDLGALYVIYHAGKFLEDRFIHQRALNMLVMTTKRKSVLETNVKDACLCHGSSGIGYMYTKLWKDSANLEFKRAADFWMYETLKFGQSNYKFMIQRSDRNLQYEESNSFLVGEIGVAISCLTYLYPHLFSWDNSMMLS